MRGEGRAAKLRPGHTADPVGIHLGNFIDDFFGETPFPLGLSYLVWVAALCLDEVEDVEGHEGRCDQLPDWEIRVSISGEMVSTSHSCP